MRRIIKLFSLVCSFFLLSGVVTAQLQSSPSYQLPESYIGPSSGVSSSSSGYSATDTVGDLGIGSSSSSTYLAQSGLVTPSEPRLAIVVNSASVAFGGLSTAIARTGTATFSVLNYTSSGYAVYIIGSAPANGSHTLNNMSGASSQTGTEQFGINLVANTQPAAFGADPVQTPDSSFSFGAASSGYNTANTYKYSPGDKVAEATKTSGQTDYTVSYLVNVSTTTPGGVYKAAQSLVVVATY